MPHLVRGKGGDKRPLLHWRVLMPMPSSSTIWNAGVVLMATIARAAHLDRNAKRDYALIRCSYLLGCRVSEIASIRWMDIEVLDD